MASLRRLARNCRDFAKQHVDDPDVPAAPDGAAGYAEWVQIRLILFRVELEKSLRETEDYLNEMPGVLAVFDLDEAPQYSSFCRWEQDYQMRELRRLLRASAEQAGRSGEAAIDASGFQRDQTSHYYRNRAGYSFQSLKTTVLIDMNSLAIKDVHYTTRKSWDGHIGMQVFRRNAEDLQILAADANYSWSDLREECRSTLTRPLIKHKEHTPLKKAHNARMDDDVYHQRWMSETGFSLLKDDDGETLRSRNWPCQLRELTRKCIVHNLTDWLTRWNEHGATGLVPRFGGGRPPKLSHQQSRDLQRLLEDGQPWTTHDVVQLVEDEFGVSYHPGYVSRLLRHTYGMSYAIPRPETPSRPDNAEEILAERLSEALGEIDADRTPEAADPGETVLGFFR